MRNNRKKDFIMFKARERLNGKQWKEFVSGLDHLDDDKTYEMEFYAKNLIDWFRFHRGVRKRIKAKFIMDSHVYIKEH